MEKLVPNARPGVSTVRVNTLVAVMVEPVSTESYPSRCSSGNRALIVVVALLASNGCTMFLVMLPLVHGSGTL